MRIPIQNTSLLVVDIQEKFVSHIYEYEKLLANCCALIKGCELLNLPIAITEQNSAKLGMTVPPIKELLSDHPYFEKIEFSCFDNIPYKEWLKTKAIKNVIICGIESHICVLQTAIDLKEAGYTPIVIWDAVSSRKLENKTLALERLKQEDVLISSTESILFELIKTFAHPQAKEISKLIK